MRITRIDPTVFLRREPRGLAQLVRLTVETGQAASTARLRIVDGGRAAIHALGGLPRGSSTHEVFLREARGPREVALAVLEEGAPGGAARTIRIEPPRHWTVHVVQRSHHDVGYTDLPSRVLKQQAGYLDEAIELARQTDRFPAESRFRIVIEAAWSLEQFLESATPGRRQMMARLLRSGRFELAGLFANMTTELCGHEEMIRALYPAFQLSRRYGFPVTSAECNDIPGLSWGLCTALADAGIQMFCPGIPQYYAWGGLPLPSHWDERAIFGGTGPGAFLWESRVGKRLLFWCDNSGCGGDARPSLSDLDQRLEKLAGTGYPYRTYLLPVAGAARDNSPYIIDYAHTIRRWNSLWAYPRLVCSTNAQFREDLQREDLSALPVHRGELPGQDYPSGSTSTAAPSAANRLSHSLALSAEKLSALVGLEPEGRQPGSRDTLALSYAEMLWHDEHTWGYHFPCGPMAEASREEKAVHAYRALAAARDVLDRTMAGVADGIRREEDGIYLAVFNSLSRARTGLVSTPLRLIDSAGEGLKLVPAAEDPKGSGYLRGVLLGNRWHVNLPPEAMDGRIDLIDAASQTPVPFQIVPVGADDPLPYAAERAGLGAGGKRYGLFEVPGGLARDLRFVASDVPGCGWRLYRITPRATPPAHSGPLSAGEDWIQNEHYRIGFDPRNGSVRSILDRASSRELLDPECPFRFGQVVVRRPDQRAHGIPCDSSSCQTDAGELIGIHCGPATASVEFRGSAPGHPRIRRTISLHAGLRRIDCAIGILKAADPLLEASVAFPFAARAPRFRYEGVLGSVSPGEDTLPGASLNALAVQNWLSMADSDHHVLWSCMECPIVSVGDFWPSRVSPAHSCVLPEPPAEAVRSRQDLRHGWVFSRILSNNFGTNFSVSQAGEALFRYAIAGAEGQPTDPQASWFGWDAVTPLSCITTAGPSTGTRAPCASLASIDSEDVELLTAKDAEDGDGVVLRLWNHGSTERAVRLSLPGLEISGAEETSIVERDTGEPLACSGHEVRLRVPAGDIVSVRVRRKG